MSATDTPPFAVACPSCRATVGVDRSLVNEPARCPLCGGTFRVPDPGPIRPTRATAPQNTDTTPAPVRSPAGDAPQPAPTQPAPQRQQSANRPTPARDDAGERARQAAQERRRRRSRRTIIVLLMGIGILVVLALNLARGRRR